jgi:hypothetical protein
MKLTPAHHFAVGHATHVDLTVRNGEFASPTLRAGSSDRRNSTSFFHFDRQVKLSRRPTLGLSLLGRV